MDVRDLITAQDAAELLGVHERTVYRYQDDGVIPLLRVGNSRTRYTSRKAVLALVSEMEATG